jgi:hypothetical protein
MKRRVRTALVATLEAEEYRLQRPPGPQRLH